MNKKITFLIAIVMVIIFSVMISLPAQCAAKKKSKYLWSIVIVTNEKDPVCKQLRHEMIDQIRERRSKYYPKIPILVYAIDKPDQAKFLKKTLGVMEQEAPMIGVIRQKGMKKLGVECKIINVTNPRYASYELFDKMSRHKEISQLMQYYISRTGPEKLLKMSTNDKGYMEYKNLIDDSVMVLVPSRTNTDYFIMGGTEKDTDAGLDEQPAREVYVDSFLISKEEIYNHQFKKFIDDTGYIVKGMWKPDYAQVLERYPATGITYEDAVEYCKWSGAQLPTEAQWEKAARGLDLRIYPWGSNWDALNLNSAGRNLEYMTTPVGSFNIGASPYGILNMAGNVWEWCQDWYGAAYYGTAPKENPKGPVNGEFKIIRGGSFTTPRVNCRVSGRGRFVTDKCANDLGLRPSMIIPEGLK